MEFVGTCQSFETLQVGTQPSRLYLRQVTAAVLVRHQIEVSRPRCAACLGGSGGSH